MVVRRSGPVVKFRVAIANVLCAARAEFRDSSCVSHHIYGETAGSLAESVFLACDDNGLWIEHTTSANTPIVRSDNSPKSWIGSMSAFRCMSLSSPDHVIIQSSAAHSNCQLIELSVSSAVPVQGTSPCAQRYFVRYYLRFHTTARLVLPRIFVFNQVSLQQLGEVNDAIRLSHGALMTCSASHGDEYHQATDVVEALCKEAVVSSSIPDGS